MASRPDDIKRDYSKASAASTAQDKFLDAQDQERVQIIEDLKKFPAAEYHSAYRTKLILGRALEDAVLAQEYAIPDLSEYLENSKFTGKPYKAIYDTFDALEAIALRHQFLIPDVLNVLDKHKNHTMLEAHECRTIKDTIGRLEEIDGFLKSQPANEPAPISFVYTA